MKAKLFPNWLRLTAVFVLLLTALAPATVAQAATCTVTTDADSGTGSLRAKIGDATCDVVTFDGDHTIVLAEQLEINRDMTIDGAGHTVTVSGNDAVRVFYVDPDVTFNLQNLNVVHGKANPEDAPNGGGQGGGLYADQATVNISFVTFNGNNAGSDYMSFGGGAIFSIQSNLTLEDVTFSNNSALMLGGGLMSAGDTLTLNRVTFSGNSALDEMSGCGGLCVFDGQVIARDTLFIDNSAGYGGGGMLYFSTGSLPSSVTLSNVVFSGNSASFAGGLGNQDGVMTLTNVVFSGNSALGDEGMGGGMNNLGNATLTNVTFNGNSAAFGPAIYVSDEPGSTVVQNSILWGNTGTTEEPEIWGSDEGAAVTYSDVQGGWTGEGNIDAEPSFVDAASGDLHLQAGSPAVDSGNQTLLPAGIITDLDGNTRVVGADVDMGAYEFQGTTSNTAPVADPGVPYLGAVNTNIAFDGSGSYDDDSDPLTYAWDLDDGTTDSGVAPTHSYTEVGIYDVCLTVNDGALDSDPGCTIAVVYDPDGGFVTGGGWIDSPAGAYIPDPDLSGKATFGFVAKYKKGASVPEGNTEFQFQAGGFNFHSESYQWLVVNQDGTNAQFKGSGTVNGELDPNGEEYKFMIWATDGDPDTFRIKIWWEDADGVEHDVYDNGVEQAIGGGSIVVHTK
jgi:PKD repeat protein